METLIHSLSEALDLTAGSWGQQILAAILMIAVGALVFVVALTFAGLLTYLERRVAGRVQSRIGPNRVGPFGLLQWLADGLKLLMKEDLIPDCADKILYRVAPYSVMLGVFAAFAAVPFGYLLIGADLDVGVLYLLAITSLVTVGILMAGWASNNKWSLLGGIRAAAQIVSYEVPNAMSVLSVVLLAGTLSMQGIIAQQGGWPWEWFLFRNPFTLVAFLTYFTAAIAEGNRTPFDLPEAESELVSGYNTEYSGMRFAGFFLGEFANIYLMSAVATTLFLGGWQIPGVEIQATNAAPVWILLSLLVFLVKAWALSFVVIWLRWTLPRLRVDQLMALCYKYLTPISFVCLAGNGLFLLLFPEVTTHNEISTLEWLIRLGTTGIGFLVLAIFFWRVFYHIRKAGDHIDLNLLARGKKGHFDPTVQVRRWGKFRGKETN